MNFLQPEGAMSVVTGIGYRQDGISEPDEARVAGKNRRHGMGAAQILLLAGSRRPDKSLRAAAPRNLPGADVAASERGNHRELQLRKARPSEPQGRTGPAPPMEGSASWGDRQGTEPSLLFSSRNETVGCPVAARGEARASALRRWGRRLGIPLLRYLLPLEQP